MNALQQIESLEKALVIINAAAFDCTFRPSEVRAKLRRSADYLKAQVAAIDVSAVLDEPQPELLCEATVGVMFDPAGGRQCGNPAKETENGTLCDECLKEAGE